MLAPGLLLLGTGLLKMSLLGSPWQESLAQASPEEEKSLPVCTLPVIS